MSASAQAPILQRRRGATLIIEFSRPHVLNAMTLELGHHLIAALDVARDPEIACVLITGTGKAFSAGADLKDLKGPVRPSGGPDLELALRECFNRPVRQIRDLQKPVVAAVSGPAVGIAASYALACDAILASESSYLLMPFTSIGLVPDGGASCLVPARVGFGRFTQMVISAERVDAPRALSWGLVDAVHPDSKLIDEAHAFCDRLSLGSTSSYASVKQMVNEGPLQGLDRALELEANLQGVRADSAEFLDAAKKFAARAR